MAGPDDPRPVETPPRTYLTDTPAGPGIAALRSCRHAWGTIQTAISRLDQEPPAWRLERIAEARAQLLAAGELVRAVGTALSRDD